MVSKIRYHLNHEPVRSTRLLPGRLHITDNGIRIESREPIQLAYEDIKSLDYKNEFGTFHIILDATPRLYITPVVFSLFGLFNFMVGNGQIAVYTALHRRLGGPGLCARCHYDLRCHKGYCPDCGGELVNPIRFKSTS